MDFVCIERGLVVEIDGGQHGSEQVIHDAERDAWLQTKGCQVLRFWNNEVLLEVESVLEVIRRSLAGAPPIPACPMKGEGIKPDPYHSRSPGDRRLPRVCAREPHVVALANDDLPPSGCGGTGWRG